MFGDMGKLMKQAQEMQAKMKDIQKELKTLEVRGDSGKGLLQKEAMVEVVASGEMEIKEIILHDKFAEKDKAEQCKLLQAAVNNALKQAKDISADKLKQATGGLKIPGL